MQKELEQYALKHYEEGGHWVVECFGRGDYDRFIVVGDLEQSKRALKKYWELIEGYAEDIRSAQCQKATVDFLGCGCIIMGH